MDNQNTTFSTRVNNFNREINFETPLPDHIGVMNPFKNEAVFETASAFYNKYYNDNNRRKLILGINPGRLGSGTTGVPFTDPKRLISECGIPYKGQLLHEPSSVFIYEMINAFGGPELFYSKFYISSVCPLGFVEKNSIGKEINYNYFDSKGLLQALQPYIEWNIQQQINMGCDTDVCYCLGLSKNYKFLLDLNKRKKYFDKIIPLQHPRFVMQYKSKEKEKYIAQYLELLSY